MRLKHGKPTSLSHPMLLDPIGRPADLEALSDFLRHPHVLLEIGFGKGRFLCQLAQRFPEGRVLGIEVKAKYTALALSKLDRQAAQNVRVVLADARHLLSKCIPETSLDGVFLMFPDPWWKARHFRRRLLDPAFMPVLASRLRPPAPVLVRSDVPMVLELARDAFSGSSAFQEAELPELSDLMTDRELACRARGIPIDEVAFRRVGEVS